jgi:hypothetical protein
MKTPYQVAEFIQTAFYFDDDDVPYFFDERTRWQEILGSDYPCGVFRDFEAIRQDIPKYHAYIKSLAKTKYGELPF